MFLENKIYNGLNFCVRKLFLFIKKLFFCQITQANMLNELCAVQLLFDGDGHGVFVPTKYQHKC